VLTIWQEDFLYGTLIIFKVIDCVEHKASFFLGFQIKVIGIFGVLQRMFPLSIETQKKSKRRSAIWIY